MVDPTLPLPGLSPVADKAVVGRFDGGRPSSDGGLLVLREVEKRLRVAERLAGSIEDPRDHRGSVPQPPSDPINHQTHPHRNTAIIAASRASAFATSR